MLILHLFGHQRALEHWAMTQCVVTPRASSRSLSIEGGQARIAFVEGIRIAGGVIVEVRGVVVRDPFDLDKIRGLEPSLVVQDQSFIELGHHVDLLARVYPHVR